MKLSLSIILKQRLFCISLLACFYFSPISSSAQYTKLLDFGNTDNGANPYATPISDGTFLYGMTTTGGTSNLGTIYKMKLDGSGFTKLLDFNGTNGSGPYGSLYSDGTFLYGMTSGGGLNGNGIIFKIKPDGTGFVDLLDFDYNTTGSAPFGSLISVGGFLYGMASGGGSHGSGTIFKILPNGTGYSKLFEFGYFINGGSPYGSLYSDGTFLYGMTSEGISNSYGTIFKIKTDGTGYTDLFDFNISNGSDPKGSLISDGTFLYGMTLYGGANSEGVIFKIMPDGSSFSKIVDFDYSALKGAYPTGSLVYDGAFLYGTTTQNFSGNGTVFKVKTDGSSFTKLLDQDVNVGGPNPEGTLFWDGASTLYGVRSGLTINNFGIGYLGSVYKINTDGSNYTKLVNYEATGDSPSGSLTAIGSVFYGITTGGGLYNYGTAFKVNADGTGYVKLLDFDGTNNGRNPVGRPAYDGTFLYGMTSAGGANDYGTIFKIKPDGTGYVKLLDFDGTNNGLEPNGSLIYDGTYLYGMTSHGGTNNYGTIFKILPNGTGYVKLLDLDYTTNGAYPQGSLVGVAGVLYGMTNQGGTNGGWGTLFQIKTDGTGFAKLIDFDYNNNGSNPNGSLIYDGTLLYGMTNNGGANSFGTIFGIKPDGTGYDKKFDFDGDNGSYPNGSLFSDGTFLYGMTSSGGSQGLGSIFRLLDNGTDEADYTKLLDFNDGSYPQASLISDGTFLYGMTEQGGANGLGTLFKITLTPFVSITSFSPSSGVEGTFVTIKGTNFDPTPNNNDVRFNSVNAAIVSGTKTSIVAVAPLGVTTGPVSVTAGSSTGTSSSNFNVTANPPMTNAKVMSCNSKFTAPQGSSNVVETFMPVTAVEDRIKVSFSSFFAPDDLLNVYDGPSTSSPLIATLNGIGNPGDIVATGSGGELTFEFVWQDGASSSWQAIISCQSNSGPVISVTTQPSDFTACVGDIATFSAAASGTSNISFQWQYSSDGIVPFTDINDGVNYTNSATATLSVNTVGSFGAGRYRCKIDGDLAITVFTDDEGLFINPLPPTPSISNGNNCGPGSVTLNASGGSNGNYLWYNTNGLISGQTDSTYTTPIISSNTTYSVAVTDGSCTSAKANANAIVNSIPTAPTSIDANNCGPGSVILSASGGTNGNYLWYDTNGLISGQNNSTYITPVVSSTTQYTVAITNGICTSKQTNVTATINTIPAIPTTQGASACGSAALTVTASGGSNGNYLWYDTNGLINGQSNSTYATPVISSTTIYSVAIANGSCNSAKVTVAAIINAVPFAPSTQGAFACPGNTFILTATGGTNGQYVWYTVLSGGSGISGQVNSIYTTPGLSTTTSYYVSINNGTCESARSPVTATVSTTGCSNDNPPVIATATSTTLIGSTDVVNLLPLLSDPDNNLDLTTLKIITQPASGATATIDTNHNLVIDYKGLSFAGADQVTIEVCDLTNLCVQKVINIEVNGDITVFNGISPNGVNPKFIIQNIESLPETKDNTVYIFDRWENQVWHGSNYDNTSVVFTGVSDSGSDLPSGVYYYKINFSSGRKTETGFISLRRQ